MVTFFYFAVPWLHVQVPLSVDFSALTFVWGITAKRYLVTNKDNSLNTALFLIIQSFNV